MPNKTPNVPCVSSGICYNTLGHDHEKLACEDKWGLLPHNTCLYVHLFVWSDNGPPYYDELPWEIVWWGGHVCLLKHINAIEIWEHWALYPNDDMVTRPLFWSWKPMSSNAKTFSHVRFVSTFISHTIGSFGQSSTHLFLLPFTHQSMSAEQYQNL